MLKNLLDEIRTEHFPALGNQMDTQVHEENRQAQNRSVPCAIIPKCQKYRTKK